jgi:hypothetical protein
LVKQCRGVGRWVGVCVWGGGGQQVRERLEVREDKLHNRQRRGILPATGVLGVCVCVRGVCEGAGGGRGERAGRHD